MAVVDPFHGLIDGVLQGHAIATQLKNQAMQEEAFQRAKLRQDQEAQLNDMEAQQRIAAAGRPVTGNMVDQSFDASIPSPVPGLPDESRSVKYSRPVDKSRLLTYKTQDGRTIQSEAYTPEELLQRHVDQARQMGQINLQNAGMTDVIKKTLDRQYYEGEVRRRGVAVPDVVVQAGLARPGEKRLPEEMASLVSDAQKMLSPEYKEVAPGASLLAVPRPGVGASSPAATETPAAGVTVAGETLPSPDTIVGTNPLIAAGASGQQNRADFVNRVRNAGQAAGGPQVMFTAPDKPTGDLEKVWMPAFAAKRGKTVGTLTPDETLQGVQEYAQRSKDPETLRLTHALTQAHLDDLRARQNTTPMPINPGTREFRIAQKLAYGELTMQGFRSLAAYSRDTNKKMDIFNKASELNPNFNPAAFEMGFKFASNPKAQQQLAALDNVLAGSEDLLKFSDAASRSGITTLNKYIQKGGLTFGGKTYSNFHVAQIAFADELSGALGFGTATDMSKQMGIDMTNPNLSPEQFRSAVENVVLPFIARKKKAMLDQMGVYGQPGMNPAAGAGPAIDAARKPLSEIFK